MVQTVTIAERQRAISALSWLIHNLRPHPPDQGFCGWSPLELEAYEQNRTACEAILVGLEIMEPPIKRSWVSEPRELGGIFVEIVTRDADESVPMASVSVIQPKAEVAPLTAREIQDAGPAVRVACHNCFAVDHTIDDCHWATP